MDAALRQRSNHATQTMAEDDGRRRARAGAARDRIARLCAAGAGRCALPAGIPARRLRRRQRAGAGRQRLLLRRAPQYRHPQAGGGRGRRSQCGGGAGAHLCRRQRRARHRRLGAAPGAGPDHAAAVAARPARLRAVCRYARPVAQPLRDPGRDRGRLARRRRGPQVRGRAARQRLPEPPGAGHGRAGCASGLHRRPADGAVRPARRAQCLAQGQRPHAVRRAPVEAAGADVQRHAFRVADR
ncbi:hypothetical protein D3C72_1613300 [compost metagenome]